ncbi:hypothetical protein NLX86_16810 [Streptomyces sp. A3M-1-3]|uniref:NAD(P)-dependent oxidoreductase n=1 Tax=Streptomyces sp. A3M-1-3 TaxID=2962044 RepID=UPI0020B71018|nr:hypothetical protein [Streptomyces sp. A3M-1-3]MCP3819696.1 hypothetical protein [Streptomyces sp. A3M-1-3]
MLRNRIGIILVTAPAPMVWGTTYLVTSEFRGAGSLTVPGNGGRTVIDDPGFPAARRGIALACNEQLDACRVTETGVDWAYPSPAALLEPGERTGNYRVGTDELLVDAEGGSAISMEDLAVALLDEAERPRHHRPRFTAAY